LWKLSGAVLKCIQLMRIKLLIITLIFIVGLFACKQPAESNRMLKERIDSLENKLSDSYKPGFGEFMRSIQAHHAKLWFAGQNQNWKLADFEVHEIMESLEDIKKYETDRKESQNIGMLNPAIDSINNAIKEKNMVQFKSSYTLLTNTCNNCHVASEFEFNVVKVPDISTFSNQDFEIKKK